MELLPDSAHPPYVTVLIPAYNEKDSIAAVIAEIRTSLATTPYDFEILVVDDLSDDGTAGIAETCGVRVLRKIRRGGAGSARKAGIRAARGEVVVMLDGDGSYDPATIPVMLAHFPTYDQVNGARDREMGTHRLLRSAAKWFIRMLASYIAGVRIPDLNTGLKAFKRSVMMRYLWMIPDGFSCVTTMTLAFLANGHEVKYVPTTYRTRIGSSKFHPVVDTLNYLKTVIKISLYFNPNRIFLPLAFVVGFAGVAKTLIDKFFLVDRMRASDIVLIVTALLIAVLSLIADLIVAQTRAVIHTIDLIESDRHGKGGGGQSDPELSGHARSEPE